MIDINNHFKRFWLRLYKKNKALFIVLTILILSSLMKKIYYEDNNTESYLSIVRMRNLSRQVFFKPATLHHCPIIPPDLKGRVTLNTDIPDWTILEKQNTMINSGGRYKPHDCLSRSRVAIIVPYRDREDHLKLFIQNLHPFLQRQQLDYGIYVIEMAAELPFNRALLMNVGYKEALQQYDYQCFIFHDVDLLPEDDRNLYTCAHMPRHMSIAIDIMQYRLPYTGLVGGVSALTKDHFKMINGYSNYYFGWGGEDDDLFKRIKNSKLTICRDLPELSRYKMLTHKKDEPSPKRFLLLEDAEVRQSYDGLNSLNYQVTKKELKRLYTWILVSVNVADFKYVD